MAGWGDFFGGIGSLLPKIPIQGRKERWKNEIDNLEKEKAQLLKGECDDKASKRMSVIITRVDELEQLLKNAASDN